MLESQGYLSGDGQNRVTEAGRMLARIYAELDLVAAEVRSGRVALPVTTTRIAEQVQEIVRLWNAGERDAASQLALFTVDDWRD